MTRNLPRQVAFTALILLGLAACSSDDDQADMVNVSEQQLLVRGAGATFPEPLYRRWINTLNTVYSAPLFVYQAVGSVEGVRLFMKGEVDFGASDAALSDEQLNAFGNDVVMVPMTAAMVVLAYNLGEQPRALKLSRDVYTAIFSGTIRSWDDPAIRALNPSLKLPKEMINLVVPAAGSGTTHVLTNHLSAISETWRDLGHGVSKQVNWPGSVTLASGNQGVADLVKNNKYTLGYVVHGIALPLRLPMAALENQSGHYVAPTLEAGRAALELNAATVPENLRLYMPDPDGARSYPIVSLSWMLFSRVYANKNTASAIQDLLHYGLTDDGQKSAERLGYIPLPENILQLARIAAARIE